LIIKRTTIPSDQTTFLDDEAQEIEGKLCKICKKEKPTTDYGLCKKCDEWLLHLAKSKAGRKDLYEQVRILKENKRLKN